MTTAREIEPAEQMERLLRGAEEVYSAQELTDRLAEARRDERPLRVKLGLDPTAPDIHLGHTVVLRKIRQFQDFGHTAVLIIGDYTARIGDPSGVNRTRPVLSPEQIEANAATYIDQAGKVLDTSPAKLEVRRNSEWLSKLTLADLLRLASQMTVARMMERDTFKHRFRTGTPIGVHELLYPLMQGYDSVCVRADVELGGTDQTFNNLVGRDLQERAGQPRQIVMTFPLLVGLDGQEKMSKSKGNYVGVTDAPNDMYGKVMSVPDALMANYFTLLTDLPAEEVRVLVDPERTHPRDAKAALAGRIVSAFHGPEAAGAAAAEFDRIFSRRQAPTDMPEIAVGPGPVGIVDLVTRGGFAGSRSEARRLIAQNAVSIDGEKVADKDAVVTPTDGQVLRVGRRRFGRITLGGS